METVAGNMFRHILTQFPLLSFGEGFEGAEVRGKYLFGICAYLTVILVLESFK